MTAPLRVTAHAASKYGRKKIGWRRGTALALKNDDSSASRGGLIIG
jgi:hypothetical protein